MISSLTTALVDSFLKGWSGMDTTGKKTVWISSRLAIPLVGLLLFILGLAGIFVEKSVVLGEPSVGDDGVVTKKVSSGVLSAYRIFYSMFALGLGFSILVYQPFSFIEGIGSVNESIVAFGMAVIIVPFIFISFGLTDVAAIENAIEREAALRRNDIIVFSTTGLVLGIFGMALVGILTPSSRAVTSWRIIIISLSVLTITVATTSLVFYLWGAGGKMFSDESNSTPPTSLVPVDTNSSVHITMTSIFPIISMIIAVILIVSFGASFVKFASI